MTSLTYLKKTISETRYFSYVTFNNLQIHLVISYVAVHSYTSYYVCTHSIQCFCCLGVALSMQFHDTHTKCYCGECEISCMCVCVARSGGAGNRGSTAKQEHQLPKEEVGNFSFVFVFLSLSVFVSVFSEEVRESTAKQGKQQPKEETGNSAK